MGIFRTGDKVKNADLGTPPALRDYADVSEGTTLNSPITGQILPQSDGFTHSIGGQLAQEAYAGELVDGASSAAYQNGTRSGVIKTYDDGDIRYTGDIVSRFFEVPATYNDTKKASDAGGDLVDWWDIAQSHFFTVQIYGTNEEGYGTGIHYLNGSPIAFASGEGVYNDYIPIKSMNFNYTSYDNMSIPLGIFGDFPLLHRKKVTSISFSCYDTDQDIIEKALHYWEQQCFPGGNYVAYLSDVVADLVYTSYDVCGNMNFQRILQVIPASGVSVSRSYEENAAKMLNFSVVAVGAQISKGAGGEHNKVEYKGKQPEQINEWKNRNTGRGQGEVYNGGNKFQEALDRGTVGNGGMIKGYVNYDVDLTGGLESGEGALRGSATRYSF